MKEEMKQKEMQIEDLESRLRDFESQQEENDDNADKLNKLYQMGLIDNKGNPIDRKILE